MPSSAKSSFFTSVFKKWTISRIFESRTYFLILLMGIASGLPLALTGGTLQAWMTESGADLKAIGLTAYFGTPYAIKFLWAPIVDRFNLFGIGRRKSWMYFSQVLLITSTVILGHLNPSNNLIMVSIFALLISFFSATQDIVLDAWRRDFLPPENFGIGNSVHITGYLFSMRIIGGALGLWMADHYTWDSVYNIMAVILGLGLMATYFCEEPQFNALPRNFKETVIEPFTDFFSKKGAITFLVFIFLYKIGDNMAAQLNMPYYLKMGFTKTEIAAVTKILGWISLAAGGIIGGIWMSRIKLTTALFIFGTFQAASTFAFVLLEVFGKNNSVLSFVIGFENFTAGMGTAAFAAFMATLTNVRFSGTQYALLTSFMRIPGIVIAGLTGVLAERLGWFNFYTFCALIAIPGIILSIWMKRFQSDLT